MARQGINTGTSPNSGTGDTLLDGGVKINDNFIEVYGLLGDGTNLAPGIVTSIQAGDNISVSAATGQVTITGSANTSAVLANTLTVLGISTLGSANGIGTVTVGIGTTALLVDGSARVTGVLTVGQDSITIDGRDATGPFIHVGSGLTLTGSAGAEVIMVGPNIMMDSASGIITASGMTVGGQTITGNPWITNDAGINTTSSVGIGTTNPAAAVQSDNTSRLAVGVVTARNIFGTNIDGLSGTFNSLTGGTNNAFHVDSTAPANSLNVQNNGDVNPGAANTINNSGIFAPTGIITANSFRGDGSQLTGITASGVGITVMDNNVLIGTASSINFGSNLSVSAVSAGLVTVTAAGGGGSGFFVSNDTGINTSTSVGIGTTTCTAPLTIRADGNTVDDGISIENIQGTQIVELGPNGGNPAGGFLSLKRSGSGGDSAQLNVGADSEVASNRGVQLWAGDSSNDHGRVTILSNVQGTQSVFRVVSAASNVASKFEPLTIQASGAISTCTSVNVAGIVTVNTGGINASSGIITAATVDAGSLSRAREDKTTTSASVSSGSTVTIDFADGYKSYALLNVGITSAAWLRLYTDAAARTADETRVQGTDPAPDAGVIAEVISTGNTSVRMSPGVIGWNNDGTPGNTIYMRLSNTGATDAGAGIGITLNLLKLED